MYGTVRQNQRPSDTIQRLVKQASADTMRKNAIRDGTYWAWIPSGDTCAFCIMLASNGWQRVSKSILKGNHCDHIHAHCDCQFMIRFNDDLDVEGYDPDKYKEIYDNAEGITTRNKVNSIRRNLYKSDKETSDKGFKYKLDNQLFGRKTSDYGTIRLSKKEYAMVVSELNSNLTAEDIKPGFRNKTIGDYIYTFEIYGFDNYRFVGKKKISETIHQRGNKK